MEGRGLVSQNSVNMLFIWSGEELNLLIAWSWNSNGGISQGKIYPSLILKGQKLWQSKKKSSHYIHRQLHFSKHICENRPGNLCQMLNLSPFASGINTGWSKITPMEVHVSLVCGRTMSLCAWLLSVLFLMHCMDDHCEDDLCFSTCIISLRHHTVMNSLSRHCTVIAQIFQSQKSETEIWTPGL